MTLRISVRIALVVAVAAWTVAGCGRKTPTEPWPAVVDAVVYSDGAGTDAEFHAFGDSKLDALSIDNTEAHSGTSSLKFTVPAVGDPTGTYAGGAFMTKLARDLSAYDALRFYVKASRNASINEAGFGIDFNTTSPYKAVRAAIPVTTSWTQVLLPIPLSAKLTKERGLFFLSEGPEGGAGCTIWVDDVEFVRLGTVTKRPVLTPRIVNALVGSTVDLAGSTRTVFNLGGADTAVTMAHPPHYFSFASSDPAVGTVTNGRIEVVAAGSDTITAKLGDIDATGRIIVNASAPPVTSPAPTPTLPAGSVLSLYSDAYPGSPVGTWSADWDQAEVTDLAIAGNSTKVYTNLVYAGIEFNGLIDATAMDYLHMDVWVPSGTTFKVKLVDFGADRVYGGCPNCGDDRESELTFNAASTPALTLGTWVGLEIPLDSFTNLTSRAHLAQIVLSGDTRTVYLDNVYFHK